MSPSSSLDRRRFLAGALGVTAGAGLLAACRSPSIPSSRQPPSRPAAGKEPGNLSVLEWPGYEAVGTQAQTAGLTVAGRAYIDRYGPDSVTYTYITNDNAALQKATSAGPFDVIHPCHENLPDYVSRGLVQPWDPDLIPSFGQLNKDLVAAGQVDGKQYLLPWDWGFISLVYRTDKVDPADATGWELAWNEKYRNKISLWSGPLTLFEIAALKLGFPKMDDLTSDQLEQAKQALIEQKPLNRFYWDSEYTQMQPALKSGTIWIAETPQDTLVAMQAANVPVAFLAPSQGRISFLCGYMLGAQTKNYYHAHEYVESFVSQASSAQMTNAFGFGTSNTAVTAADIKNKALVAALRLDDPNALTEGVHMQSRPPNRPQLLLALQEVLAS